jgi:hypothetical protein
VKETKDRPALFQATSIVVIGDLVNAQAHIFLMPEIDVMELAARAVREHDALLYAFLHVLAPMCRIHEVSLQFGSSFQLVRLGIEQVFPHFLFLSPLSSDHIQGKNLQVLVG